MPSRRAKTPNSPVFACEFYSYLYHSLANAVINDAL